MEYELTPEDLANVQELRSNIQSCLDVTRLQNVAHDILQLMEKYPCQELRDLYRLAMCQADSIIAAQGLMLMADRK